MSDEEQKIIFSKNLNYYVYQSGKQQKEIAEILGFNPKTFNGWCKGLSLPTMGKVQKIADYFGIGKSDLLDEHTQEEPTYYLNEEAREMAQFMFDNPEYKVLFDASRKVNKADIDVVKDIMDKFKGDN